MLKVTNYILFYLGWIICIYSGAHHQSWMALTSAIVIVLFFFILSKHKRAFLAVLFFSLLCGFLIDSSFKLFEWIHYEDAENLGAPIWILSLYAIFATSIGSSLNFLKNRLWLASIAGFIAGPLSYRAAALLGAVTFLKPDFQVYLAAGIFWALFLPIVLYVYDLCE